MILVTGATGRVGERVVRELRRVNLPVRALVRPGSQYFWLNDTGCSYFFGDLRDSSTLSRACREVEYLIICSGVGRESRSNDHQASVDGHQRLLEAARSRGVEHVVFVSSLGVDRGYEIPWFDARAQTEASLARSGMKWSVVRAAPLSRTFAELALLAEARGRVVLPGPALNRLSVVSTRDVALFALAALDFPGAVIQVGGADVRSAREVVSLALSMAGVDVPVATMPRVLAGASARLARVAGRRWTHHIRHQSTWFTDDFVVEMDDLSDQIGISAMSLRDSLTEDLALLRERADPSARIDGITHRRFTATVYTPGTSPLDSLPTGPVRYDD
jgi:uncharacterized protein YbjT (DUF2867 family)